MSAKTQAIPTGELKAWGQHAQSFLSRPVLAYQVSLLRGGRRGRSGVSSGWCGCPWKQYPAICSSTASGFSIECAIAGRRDYPLGKEAWQTAQRSGHKPMACVPCVGESYHRKFRKVCLHWPRGRCSSPSPRPSH